MTSNVAPILINDSWQVSAGMSFIQAVNPKTMQPLPGHFPISPWADVNQALVSAEQAFDALRKLPGGIRADFLEKYAQRIEARRQELTETAALETGLPVEPRLNVVELPRTVDQLRQAAAAVREGNWSMPTVDAGKNIRSLYIPLGPALVIGPNNFPFAYNSVAGGDFASAIASGCPVLAKGHPAHPKTTQLLAEEAHLAANEAGLPAGTVQMIYHLSPEEGLKLVADSRITAVGFTGSRPTGLALKKVADELGKPIFLEMSSLNPVVLLPGALQERPQVLLDEVSASCLLGMGQFCTNPGLLLLMAGPDTNVFLSGMAEKYRSAPVGTMLTQGVRDNLTTSVQAILKAGAELIVGGQPVGGTGFSFQHTLLRATGRQFLKDPHGLQREAFGNATLVVVCENITELKAALQTLEGQLCGSIYSHLGGQEDALYAELEPILRQKVGRLLNDKMPTGVAVTAAMNHGGPFPATGHPHFTAVGFPASLRRFCMLACYDNVRTERLPKEVR